MLGLDLSAARLADEERPVRRALVVLPPRHMTAALRHRQSRSARLRGQLRPSDDRLASDRWARSLSGPSPACRSPVRLAARGPLACSPPPPRVPAPPRFPVHLTALELRRQTARSGRQSSGRPGGRCSAPSESVRPRVLLPPPPPLHPVPVCRESCFVHVCMCRMCVWAFMSHLSLYLCGLVDRYSGLDGSGGPRRRLVTDFASLRGLGIGR